MKINLTRSPLISLFLFLLITSCSGGSSGPAPSTTNEEVSHFVQDKYYQEYEKWKSKDITNYQITVEVFSSLLPPSCNMKANLIINNNKISLIDKLITPIPFQLDSTTLIENPECSDYERYTISSQFDYVNNIIKNGRANEIDFIEFDDSFGYITQLRVVAGEGLKDIRYSLFVSE